MAPNKSHEGPSGAYRIQENLLSDRSKCSYSSHGVLERIEKHHRSSVVTGSFMGAGPLKLKKRISRINDKLVFNIFDNQLACN